MFRSFILTFLAIPVFLSLPHLPVARYTIAVREAEAGEKTFGLREAVSLAMENNHEIRAYRNSLSAQREDVGIARSYLLPKITFEERFMRTTNPTYAFMAKLNQERFSERDFAVSSLNSPEAVNDFQTSLSVEQPLFMRKANVGLDMSRTEYSAKSEDYLRKKEEVALKVARAYLSVLTAGEYVSVSEKAVEDAREHLRISELRYSTGLGLYSDVLRASTALTGAEQRKVSALKNLAVAKRALGLLLGLAEPVDASSGSFEIPFRDVIYYTDASLTRKDVKSLEFRYENARNNLRLAEAGYLPVVGVGGSYQLNDHRKPFGSEGDSWQLMAFLRWELFDGAKRAHERTKAKYGIAETEERLEEMKKGVTFKVHEAYLAAEEAKKNSELSAAALRTAEEGKRLVRVRYENSLSPIIDLLDAQLNLDRARADAVARENEYRLAIVALGYESGTILSDLKIE